MRFLKALLRGRRDKGSAQPRLNDMAEQLARMEKLLVRVQRDAERIKLFSSLILEPTRAVALLANGDGIYVDPRDRGCAINLLTGGKYEEDEIQAFRRFLRPGAVVLDIGANYGYYSIVAARSVRPGGRVIGFEPNPHIHDLFDSSIYLNGFRDVVEARRLGVHDTNGTLRFQIDEAGPGGAHIIGQDHQAQPGTIAIQVPVVRLDDHLPSDLIVDAVKIDVEGHEESVLRGMRDVIARSPDIVIIMELFYPFFPSDEAFVRYIAFLTEELGLTINHVGAHGRVTAAGAGSLRGGTGTVALSKGPLPEKPDIAIYPVQLNRSDDAELTDGAINWQGATRKVPMLIAYGPYIYVPKGAYRLIIEGDFDGEFICRVQENFGDMLWEGRIESGSGLKAWLSIAIDAPRLEIGFWSLPGGNARFRLRKVELWRLD